MAHTLAIQQRILYPGMVGVVTGFLHKFKRPCRRHAGACQDAVAPHSAACAEPYTPTIETDLVLRYPSIASGPPSVP